mgnify:CR=1 FL=1
MTSPAEARSPKTAENDKPIELDLLLYALPYPIFVLAEKNRIVFANAAAESFLSSSIAVLKRQTLDELLAFGCPLLPLLDQVRRSGATVNEYGVEMHSPKFLMPKLVDVHAGPFPERAGHILLMIQQRNMAQMIERQFTHRAAARTVVGQARYSTTRRTDPWIQDRHQKMGSGERW